MILEILVQDHESTWSEGFKKAITLRSIFGPIEVGSLSLIINDLYIDQIRIIVAAECFAFKDKLPTSIGPKIDLRVITFLNPSDHVFSWSWTRFPKSPLYPPSQGGQTPHPDIPKIKKLQIIWENTCCDFFFNQFFKIITFWKGQISP